MPMYCNAAQTDLLNGIDLEHWGQNPVYKEEKILHTVPQYENRTGKFLGMIQYFEYKKVIVGWTPIEIII